MVEEIRLMLDENSTTDDYAKAIYDAFGVYEYVPPETRPQLLKLFTSTKSGVRKMRTAQQVRVLDHMRGRRMVDEREITMIKRLKG